MDGCGPDNRLGVLRRTRRNQVPMQNPPVSQCHVAQFDQPQFPVRFKFRMRPNVHLVDTNCLDP